jgi:hypothetical protein
MWGLNVRRDHNHFSHSAHRSARIPIFVAVLVFQFDGLQIILVARFFGCCRFHGFKTFLKLQSLHFVPVKILFLTPQKLSHSGTGTVRSTSAQPIFFM